MRTKKIKNTVKPLSEPRVITRTIGQLKDEEHFELYFDQETFAMLSERNWKVSELHNIPDRMLEIMRHLVAQHGVIHRLGIVEGAVAPNLLKPPGIVQERGQKPLLKFRLRKVLSLCDCPRRLHHLFGMEAF